MHKYINISFIMLYNYQYIIYYDVNESIHHILCYKFINILFIIIQTYQYLIYYDINISIYYLLCY